MHFYESQNIDSDVYHHRMAFVTSVPTDLDIYDFIRISHSTIRCACDIKIYKGHHINHGWDNYYVTQDKKLYSLLSDIRNNNLDYEPSQRKADNTTPILVFSESEINMNSPWDYIPRELYKHVGYDEDDIDYIEHPPGFDFKYDYLISYEYGYDIDIDEIEKIIDQVEDYHSIGSHATIYNMRHEKFN
tara:strand:- start:97 stop:660 length:564 start_codon:yes stop_codon:yes gene_type:complete